MITVGLTGSIGMGKSATGAMFEAEGCPVYDADAEVHRLYMAGGGAAAPLGEAFPGVVGADGAVDRAALSARVVGDHGAMDRLNRIVHPLLGASRREFFRKAEALAAEIVVLDIPLLFETGGERNVDAVVVVSAPAQTQRQRVLARQGMSAAKLDAILARQIADVDKRARADFVIDTSAGFEEARRQVRDVIAALKDPTWRKRRLEGAGEPGH
ncbi:MAG TPA: dephospho-CoA kinase [Caulobacteraceae bacterium]|nr:dephospho-CoA kinase [Caulobacteraceae bacterium]